MTNELSTNINSAEEMMIHDLTEGTLSYCSMKADTHDAKMTLFRGMNNPDKKISDCINQGFKLKDIYVEVVNATNPETGEVDTVPRTVLFADDGTSYTAVSRGIFSALKKLISVFGPPTWDEPIPVIIRQINSKNRKLLTLDVNF